MKSLTGQELAKLIERHGWNLVRIHGSHHIYNKAGVKPRISIPIHGNRPLKAGLARHLLKISGVPEEEWR